MRLGNASRSGQWVAARWRLLPLHISMSPVAQVTTAKTRRHAENETDSTSQTALIVLIRKEQHIAHTFTLAKGLPRSSSCARAFVSFKCHGVSVLTLGTQIYSISTHIPLSLLTI